MKKPTIDSIKIVVTIDEYPDLSYLDQFENSQDPEECKYYERDQERKRQYNDGYWNCIAIQAQATIQIEQTNITPKCWTLHTITSPGLWGIESNSGNDYFMEIAAEEVDGLHADLRALNVALRGFNKLKAEALEEFIQDI